MADRRGKRKVWDDDDAKQAPQSSIPPTPNWEDNVAAHDEKRSVSSAPREEHQIPSLSSSGYDGERKMSHHGKLCKYYTLEACPYGARCPFLHDEQPSPRENEAITISPTAGGGGGGNSGRRPNQKPINWKGNICEQWERAYCQFGTGRAFSHGLEEPQGVVSSRTSTDNAAASTTSVPHGDVNRMGPMPLERARQLWGPKFDKINRVYADWIDDLEPDR